MTEHTLVEALTSKNDKEACALADRIVAESRESSVWYPYWNDFVRLLRYPKSMVRIRALNIVATNVRWDTENRFDDLLPAYLAHITDERPITARQCIKALTGVGRVKPRYIPAILAALEAADFSDYPDSMRPLLEKDAAETEKLLRAIQEKEETGGEAWQSKK